MRILLCVACVLVLVACGGNEDAVFATISAGLTVPTSLVVVAATPTVAAVGLTADGKTPCRDLTFSNDTSPNACSMHGGKATLTPIVTVAPATETPKPTNTPLPRPTLTPIGGDGDASPGALVAEDRAYFQAISQIIGRFGNALVAVNKLTKAPEYSASWILKLDEQAQLMNDSQYEMAKVQPPAHLQTLHSKLSVTMSMCHTSVTTLQDAMRTADVEKVNIAAAQMNACTQSTNESTVMLNAELDQK